MAHSLRRGVQACPRRRCGSTRFGIRTRAVTPEAAGHPGNPARPRPAGRSARPAVTRFLARELADVLDPTDAQGVPLIPLLAAGPLGQEVLGVPAPRRDRLQRFPVRDRDPEAVRPAGRLDAEEPGLLAGEFLHALRGRGVAVAPRGPD